MQQAREVAGPSTALSSTSHAISRPCNGAVVRVLQTATQLQVLCCWEQHLTCNSKINTLLLAATFCAVFQCILSQCGRGAATYWKDRARHADCACADIRRSQLVVPEHPLQKTKRQCRTATHTLPFVPMLAEPTVLATLLQRQVCKGRCPCNIHKGGPESNLF